MRGRPTLSIDYQHSKKYSAFLDILFENWSNLKNNGDLFDLDSDLSEQHPLSKDAETTARAKLQAVLDSMPESTSLPFPHRSLSAFKKRAEAAKAGSK